MRIAQLLATVVLLSARCLAQSSVVPGDLTSDVRTLVEIPAVPGYEQELAMVIADKLKNFGPRIDEQANVTVTLGAGSPHRLIVTPIDEPGFVVSGITPEGYLTVQRLPQNGNLPLFNELHSAQPVLIGTRLKTWINGAVAGLSIHLTPQRQHLPSPADLDNIYIDVGASTDAEARNGGADVLSPVAIQRRFYDMGFGNSTAPAIGDRFGAAVLIDVLRHFDRTKLNGSVTFAFVAQQWLGARGLQRVVNDTKPDEIVYVGRCMRGTPVAGQHEPSSFQHKPGDGVLLASERPDATVQDLAADLMRMANEHQIKVATDYSAPLLPQGSYMAQPKLPQRTVHLAVATSWPSTPAEFLHRDDATSLAALISFYLGSARKDEEPRPAAVLPEPHAPDRPHSAPGVENVLRDLVETYAASEHEQNMRSAVAALLPAWAHPVTDEGGNLVLHVSATSANPSQKIVVVAHMDEIGYEVHSILPDGRLELKDEGGGVLAYFLGHAALVHSSNGMHAGVLELPDGWEKPDFQWPRGRGVVVHMNVGAKNAEQVSQLGIRPGDFITVPKAYEKLLGTRAIARSFDDRVGCTALVRAVWALAPSAPPALADRDVTFIWSTREELGLFGAAAAAKHFAENGKAPTFVFAVDTFVSSDSPLESKRFGDALLGHGFVVRAVDNSNVVPRKFVDRVLDLAHTNRIDAQYGVTGGGNDGAAFLLYGTTDVALGWPLRYSHSPAEVVDVRDVDALSKIIAAIVKGW